MTGELRQVTIASWPAPRSANQIAGTVSVMVEYRDTNGHRIALVHQYVHPDGTLGGSGLPDPKALIHDGIFYLLAPPG